LLWGALALVVVVVLLLGQRAWLRAGRRARQRHALACEDRAGDLLRSLGFDIVGRQVRTSFVLTVDGAPIVVELRADYVVSLDDRRFVAEVKSGRIAPRIETAATRRQLLEYRFAFDVDGVLLVDAEAERVSEIVFFDTAAPPSIRSSRGVGWFLVGAAVGAAAVVGYLR
jgi:hypothetical protein